MNELDLQDKYLIHFFCERPHGLKYKEAKANTVSAQFFINEDLKETTTNSKKVKTKGNTKILMVFGYLPLFVIGAPVRAELSCPTKEESQYCWATQMRLLRLFEQALESSFVGMTKHELNLLSITA